MALGIGQSVVVGPIYVAEIAPAPIRGLCTCFYAGFAYLALVIAYFASYGAALQENGTPAQWVGDKSVGSEKGTNGLTANSYQSPFHLC